MNAFLVLAQLYWKKTGNKEDTITLFIFGGIAFVFILILVIRQLLTPKKPGSSSVSSARSGHGAFKRAARNAGLAEDEIHFLEEYGKTFDTSNPELLFKNQARLDAFFKSVYHGIEKNSDSEVAADGHKAKLFAIRERIAQADTEGARIGSTRQLGKGMPLTFDAPGEASYPSVVIAIEPGGLAVEPARDAYNETIRFRKSVKLNCYFYAKGHKGYQFSTHVSGWEHIGSKEVMLLAHSDSVTALPVRNHIRREIKLPCSFFRVIPAASKKAKATIEKIPYPGTIVDLSAGGVGIQSANPLQAGDFLKIEFDPGGGRQSAFGKVVRMNRLRGSGGVMHVQFAKVSQKALNTILSFVFGYSE